jgi:hypothetical protein
MKIVILIFCALLVLVMLSGCMALTKAQLEGKLPRIDAKRVEVEANTIWGVAGSLSETDVKWEGDMKRVGSSTLKITSPLGTYKRTIEGAKAEKSETP